AYANRQGNGRGDVRPVLLILTLLVPVYFLAGDNKRQERAPRRQPIYRFDARADELLAILFPSPVPCSGVTNAYLWLDNPPVLRNLEEVCEHHSRGIDRAPGEAHVIDFSDDVLDSYWLSLNASNGRARQLLRRAAEVEALARGLCKSLWRFSSPLEKAL